MHTINTVHIVTNAISVLIQSFRVKSERGLWTEKIANVRSLKNGVKKISYRLGRITASDNVQYAFSTRNVLRNIFRFTHSLPLHDITLRGE